MKIILLPPFFVTKVHKLITLRKSFIKIGVIIFLESKCIIDKWYSYFNKLIQPEDFHNFGKVI